MSPAAVLISLQIAVAAEPVSIDFATDAGGFEGGEVGEGVLALVDGSALLELGSLDLLSVTLRWRKVDEGAMRVLVGGGTWSADFTSGGALRLGVETLPFPSGHRTWIADPQPVFQPADGTTGFWQDGSVLHCDVAYDDASATWYLYYTGEMAPGYGYRQIGVLTSIDAVNWVEYAANPVLTIDYDTTTVDGIHVHMPTVVIDPLDGGWHMFYSCYQDDVGNRICHATSDDGLDWTLQGIALDRGVESEFDSESLREPDVQISADGTWHLLYQGTQPGEHYGPTGYATSSDGDTWTKHGQIAGTAPSVLQGGGVVQSPYGVEQWFNCDDAFCYAQAAADDWTTWTYGGAPTLTKDWADWNSGYIQAPSPWLVDDTYHIWFNAYDYGTGLEVLAHAQTKPQPGEWATLQLDWDGSNLVGVLDGGPALQAVVSSVDSIVVEADGRVELDEIWYLATPSESSGGGDTGNSGGTFGVDTGEEPVSEETTSQDHADIESTGGCACAVGPRSSGAVAWCGLGALVALVRRRRRQR